MEIPRETGGFFSDGVPIIGICLYTCGSVPLGNADKFSGICANKT